jgi:preprotein translocase subunit YajC
LFATQAMAQTPAGAAAAGGGIAGFGPTAFFVVAMLVVFYFFMIRPQQRRMKQHADMVGGLKRGDEVVLSSGLKGKVTKVDDTDVSLEIAPNVTVRVVKSMISDVRTRGEPAPANDLVK